MSRKNIYDLIMSQFDLDEEISRIEEMITSEKEFICNSSYCTFEYFLDRTDMFRKWAFRGTALSTEDYRDRLGISSYTLSLGNLNISTALNYLEYVYNLTVYTILSLHDDNNINYKHSQPILDNLKIIISKLNHEIHRIDKENGFFLMLIEKNPAAKAAAELIKDDERSLDVIRYNHHALKGNLDEKRKILSQLYKEFEKVRPNIANNDLLETIDNQKSTLESDLGLLFNNTDIRHYKGTNKNIQTNFKNLGKEGKEEWYDKIYDMFLSAILVNDYIETKPEINLLKKEKN